MEKNLSSEQRLKAEDLLSTMYPEMIPTYLSLLAQTDPFPKLRFREEARQVSSTVWWKSLTGTGSKVSEDFIELAIRLVSAPASSASIERIFSTFVICTCSQQSSEQTLLKKLKNWCIAIKSFAETQQTTLIDNRINYIILNFIKFNLINTNLLMN